jgi:hypothetical protein
MRMTGSTGGRIMPEDELCDCGNPECHKTLKVAEDEYRSGVIISVCACHWAAAYRLHRVLKKLQGKYPSMEAAKSDPKADGLWDKYYEAYGYLQMKVDEELWRIDEYKKKHGRYPGMEKKVQNNDTGPGPEANQTVH